MIRGIIFRHWAVIVLALLAGTFTLAPQLMLVSRMGSTYAGIQPEISPDEGYYMTRQEDALDGHPTLGNPYLFEEKNEPSLQVWIPDAFLAWGGFIVFHDIHTGALAWDFILPAIIVLLSYAIFMMVTKRRLVSLGASALLSIGLYLETFERAVSPQFNFIFHLLFLLSFFAVILEVDRKRRRLFTLLATIAFGILFYEYTYYWTYAVILLALAIAGCFVFFRNARLHLPLAAILGGGLVIGIPYFWGVHAASKLPYYQESLARVGMIMTHSPSGISIVIAGLAVLIVMGVLSRLRMISFTPLTLSLAAGVLAGIIAVNQAVITGLNLEFSSHYYLVSMYADFFALALCVQAVLSRMPHRAIVEKIILSLVLIFSLISAGRLVYAQSIPLPSFIALQRYAPVLAWLQANTKTDDVVYADETLSNLIPQYTHDNVFYDSAATLFIAPQADIRLRFLTSHYFDPVPSYAQFTTGLGLERQIYGNYYIDYSAHLVSLNSMRRVIGLASLPIVRYPEADINDLLQQWKELQGKPFSNAVSDYRVDYVVWDSTADPTWNLSGITNLHQVYQSDGITVYAYQAS